MARAERSRTRVLGWGLLAGIAALALIPTYLMMPAGWRPLVLRLACAAIVMLGARRIVASVRRAIADTPVSPLDATPAPRPRPALDERFLRLRDDVRFSLGSRRYFETILWPRLRALGAVEPPPAREGRGWRRRGLPWRMLDRVIAHLESRP